MNTKKEREPSGSLSFLQRAWRSGPFLFQPGPLTLHLEQLGVVSSLRHQLTVGAPLIYLTAGKQQDLVGIDYGREPVSDGDGGALQRPP